MDHVEPAIRFDGYCRATWTSAKLNTRKERSLEFVTTASLGLSLSQLPEEAFFERQSKSVEQPYGNSKRRFRAAMDGVIISDVKLGRHQPA